MNRQAVAMVTSSRSRPLSTPPGILHPADRTRSRRRAFAAVAAYTRPLDPARRSARWVHHHVRDLGARVSRLIPGAATLLVGEPVDDDGAAGGRQRMDDASH